MSRFGKAWLPKNVENGVINGHDVGEPEREVFATPPIRHWASSAGRDQFPAGPPLPLATTRDQEAP